MEVYYISFNMHYIDICMLQIARFGFFNLYDTEYCVVYEVTLMNLMQCSTVSRKALFMPNLIEICSVVWR